MAKVLLGVTGGIAAYKACELTRLLVKAGHDVVPSSRDGADRFVRRETFAALARRPAMEDLYPHLTRADLLVIAPLTANTMAKLAYGLADDVLTEAALAHRGPVLVAPAMNPRMWSHPATQANAATLRERGVELIGPDEGETAEGELGVGRMAEPEEIFERVQELLEQPVPGPGPGTWRRAPARQARARDRRRNTRAARRGALRRQPLLRAHGRRARRGSSAPRRRGDPDRVEPRGRAARRDRDRPGADRSRRRAGDHAHTPAPTSSLMAAAVVRLPPGANRRGEAAEGRADMA